MRRRCYGTKEYNKVSLICKACADCADCGEVNEPIELNILSALFDKDGTA